MKPPDYEAIRARLLKSEDQQVLRLVRIMDPVFRRARFRPSAISALKETEINDFVSRCFPTPFARSYGGWANSLELELRDALAAYNDTGRQSSSQFALEQRLRLRFRTSTLQIEACWKQIVHFLPFIFISSLRRLDDEALRGDAAKELARALKNYNAFYVQHSLERQKETVQYYLLASLLKLFRQLGQRKGLGADFVFSSMMISERKTFSDIFPDEFDAGMLFLQELRNRLTHGGLADRLPVDAIEPVADLVKWVFLDLVLILSALCQRFGLNFVVESRVGASEVLATTLDFSGSTGPVEQHFSVAKEWQLEEYAFLPYRMYLVNRVKEVTSESGGNLDPADYLDLTPFIIVDRLKASDPVDAKEEADRSHLLFVLQQYLEPVRQLLFSDLGGSGDRTRPANPRDVEADGLLRLMGDFRQRYRGLTDQFAIRDQKRLAVSDVKAGLSRVSRDHLATILDVGRYDEGGALKDDVAPMASSTSYIEELYIDPLESGQIASFLTSGKRGLLVVGPSGAGKSNVLVHHYLKVLRSGDLAVYLSGRRFEAPRFTDGLSAKMVRLLSDAWPSLDELNAFLEENDETLAVFVDAINEYTGPSGARSLLESLIGDISSAGLQRLKVIATVRTEVWEQYRALVGAGGVLDAKFFPTAEPLRMSQFEHEDIRKALFEKYQAYYQLEPARFDDLSPGIKAMIVLPFMMSMIAETYSNRDPQEDARRRIIPGQLDYFSVFGRLTERKARDAQLLVPFENVVAREAMPEALEDFCALLAKMVFDRLTVDNPQHGRDALPVDAVNKSAELEPYVQSRYSISVLEAALQVGLVERIAIPQRNRDGKLISSAAFKFFHDQFTQYCLGAAFQREVLGWLDELALADKAALERLVGKIAQILRHSVSAPVLSGALDHWLQKNIVNFHERRIRRVIPLFNELVAHGAPETQYRAIAILSHFVIRGLYSADDVYRAVFQEGTPALRLALVDSFAAFWPDLGSEAMRDFIDCCDPREDYEVIDRLGDVFALKVASEPERVVAYLNDAIGPLSLSIIAQPMRVRRQSRFAIQFTIFAVFSCFDRPNAMQAVRAFVRAKFRVVLDLVDDGGAGSIVGRITRHAVRQVLFKFFDSFGVAQWHKFIAAMEDSGNDRFFEEFEGVVQQELVAEFLGYVIQLHNGETRGLSLAEGSDFRALCLRMLDFRPASVVGYNATLALPGILIGHAWEVTESLVMELVDRRTAGAIFHGQLILSNLAFSDRERAGRCLELFRDQILPGLLADGLICDWSMSFCIASLDVEGLWPAFKGILDLFTAHFEAKSDREECAAFGDHLYKVCFCSDLELGHKVISLLLSDRQRFLGPLWRVCTLKVLAAMQVRSPQDLYRFLAEQGVDEALAREARRYQSAEIVKQSRLFPFQVNVNRCVAWIFVAEPRLRRAVIKYFIGSLALGDSVADFPRGVRQTMVAIMNVFFGDNADRVSAGPLSKDEVAEAIVAAREGSAFSGGHASRS